MKSRPMPLLLYYSSLLTISIFSINVSVVVVLAGPASNVLRFDLIHRHHAPELWDSTSGPPPPRTRLERVVDLIHCDNARQEMIAQKLGLRRVARELRAIGKVTTPPLDINSIGVPLWSAAHTGTGQFFVSFLVGTPSQKFTLIADTGSDLTWINCNNNCTNCPRRSVDNRRMFNADLSSSFKTIPCSSRFCKIGLMESFSLSRCPTPNAACGYDYRYVDGSASIGFFANETVVLGFLKGRKTRLQDVVVGCSKSSSGKTVKAGDGIMGLGNGRYSFATKASEAFGGKFAYCLVDHLSPLTVHGYLTFGNSGNATTLPHMQYTALVTDVFPTFYAVNVKGISIDGVMLKIPTNAWDARAQAGVILDSGTSLTLLTQPAYGPVMDALTASLEHYKKMDVNVNPLEFCFNSTGFNESRVPKLAFHFAGGAVFEPPVKSYVIDVADGVKCLGFASSASPGPNVIGNIMQQNHLWEFDVKRHRLGFIPSSCTQV